MQCIRLLLGDVAVHTPKKFLSSSWNILVKCFSGQLVLVFSRTKIFTGFKNSPQISPGFKAELLINSPILPAKSISHRNFATSSDHQTFLVPSPIIFCHYAVLMPFSATTSSTSVLVGNITQRLTLDNRYEFMLMPADDAEARRMFLGAHDGFTSHIRFPLHYQSRAVLLPVSSSLLTRVDL